VPAFVDDLRRGEYTTERIGRGWDRNSDLPRVKCRSTPVRRGLPWLETRRSFLGCYAQSLVDDHEVAYVNLVVLVRGQEVKTVDFRFLSRALMATS
jgi:hypothetical protein